MIEIVGTEGSSEYRAAIMVRDALEAAWPGVASSLPSEENIKIAVSVKISGYKIQDIDIVLAGRLARPRQVRLTRVTRGFDGNRLSNRPLIVETFVVAIEVKDQEERSVRINDDQVQVRYSRGKVEWKSATDQNVNQVHSLKAYFADQYADVFVRRCMIFPSLAKITAPSALASGFNGHNLFSAIASPSPVHDRNGQGLLIAGNVQAVDRVLASPLFRRMIPTRLDRARMERVAATSPAVDELCQLLGTGAVFLRGYGGTGKTVLLLQAAWKAFKAEGKRTLILTYNLALAADLRRLMALMGIPSSSEEGGVEVGTVMSYFYKWFTQFHLLDENELDFSQYPSLCQTATEMIESGAVTDDDIENIVSAQPDKFDFDQIFVDEGQDWPRGEITLLKALSGARQLCIADGIDQFTRGERADWRAGISRGERKTKSLATCLRLKRNLSVFVADVAQATGVGWTAKANPTAGGGRVIVLCKPYEAAKDLHEQLIQDLREDGNAPVDILYCVPPSRVQREGEIARSSLSAVLARWGLDSWDGVDPNSRLDFARSSEQVRIVQYASCRGLEGWTVVLDGFDEFLESVAERKYISGLSEVEREGFVDLKTASIREAWRWGMIALTRPIDTLVIQLSNPKSQYSRQILEVAKAMNDFVDIVD